MLAKHRAAHHAALFCSNSLQKAKSFQRLHQPSFDFFSFSSRQFPRCIFGSEGAVQRNGYVHIQFVAGVLVKRSIYKVFGDVAALRFHHPGRLQSHSSNSFLVNVGSITARPSLQAFFRCGKNVEAANRERRSLQFRPSEFSLWICQASQHISRVAAAVAHRNRRRASVLRRPNVWILAVEVLAERQKLRVLDVKAPIGSGER